MTVEEAIGRALSIRGHKASRAGRSLCCSGRKRDDEVSVHTARYSSCDSSWSVCGITCTGTEACHCYEASILELFNDEKRTVIVLEYSKVPVKRVRRPVGSTGA